MGTAEVERGHDLDASRRARRLAVVVAVVAVVAPLSELLVHGTRFDAWGPSTDVALLAVALIAAIGGLRRWYADRRGPVALMTLGLVCWAIGQTTRMITGDILDSTMWPGPADAWFLMFPMLVVSGLILRGQGFARIGRMAVFSDAALLVTALWFLLWVLVIADGVGALESHGEQIVVALYAFGGVAVAALAVVMMIRQFSPTLFLVFLAGLALGVGDTVAAATWGEAPSWTLLVVYGGRVTAMAAMAALSVLPSRPISLAEGRPQLLRLIVVYVPGTVALIWGIGRYVVGSEAADPVAGTLALLYALMLAVNQTMRWFEGAAYANELRGSLERLGSTESQLRDLLGDIPEALLVLDSAGTILEANQSMVELTGRQANELVGSPFTGMLRADDHERTFEMFASMLDGGEHLSPILILDRHDGEVFVEAAARVPVRDPDRIAVTLRDVTERISRATALEHAQERFRRAFQGAPTGMALITLDRGEMIDVNEALEKMIGISRADLIGRQPFEFTHPEDRGRHTRVLEASPSALDAYVTEQRFVRFDGEILWTRLSVSLLEDVEHGRVAIAHVEDITEQRHNARQLEWAATHDDLTGLPNRAKFMSELLRRVADSPAGTISVLFIDLDNFKVVNDSLGHASGDEMLRRMSERLSECLREGDLLCRFGGDEFVVMLSSFADEGSPKITAERLRREISRPLMIDGVELFVTGSIGIAVADSQTATASDLLRDADAAMYRAKARGRDFVEVFAPGVHDASVMALRTSNELRRAIERDEIVPYYQPIIELSTGLLTGFEVLARWRHPERGLLGADQFLPMAEETGLITEVGASVLRASLVQLGRWRDRSPDFAGLSIAVNVSSRQLLSTEFVETVADALAEAGVPAASLWLEITETALMTDVKAATVALRELRSLGLHLSVDDFGTGYSSLTYLKRFPVEAIKVDRSFVNGLGIDAEDSTIVEAVINLGHSLGLGVVAEGVETPLQLSRLRDLGCDRAQGYLFGRPRPAEIIEAERTLT